MPCVSDFMDASPREREASRVIMMLEELETGVRIPQQKNWRSHWDGYHPEAYNKTITGANLDKMVANLCAKLKRLNEKEITYFSLETQMWWRDHQEADALRTKHEEEAVLNRELREKALAKLSPVERKALGV